MTENTENGQTSGLPPAKLPAGKGFDYLSALLMSWLIPGAGHFALGYRVRGLVLGAAILGLFWAGQCLAELRAVNRGIHPVFFCGQVGNGLSAYLSNRFWGTPKKVPQDVRMRKGVDYTIATHHNTGILFTSISGLLNMLLVLHIADPRTWSLREIEKKKEPGGTT